MNYMAAASSTSSPFFVGVMEEDQNHTKQIQYPIAAPTSSNTTTPPPPQKKKRNLPGTPNPDAEIIALSPKSLMATNRFICEVCNKGFQREQNLQLHRRGHNLPWKLKQKNTKDDQTLIKRKVYLCPEPTCVHHHPSRPLGDLTGIKKHYSRKHGEKKYKCDKCSKKYAVQSDWKAHSKTCGTKEYRCDCGTLFSRRDSFITHRAFCEALAHESGRQRPTLSTISSHLFGSNPINLGLSQINDHHNNPSPNNLLPSSNINPTPSNNSSFSNQSQFLVPDSTQQQSHNYREHNNSVMPNKSFHGFMQQLPDLQSNNNNSPSNLCNLDFFSTNNSNIGNNNNNNVFMDYNSNCNNITSGGGQGMSLFYNDHVGCSTVSSIYESQNSGTYMSATALLQKASQIGSTTSSNLSKMDNESQLQGLMDSFANAGSSIYSTDEDTGFCGFSASRMEANKLNNKFGISIGGSTDDRMTLDFLGVGRGRSRILRNIDAGGFSQSFDPKFNSLHEECDRAFGGGREL